jgi:hypothetical protein
MESVLVRARELNFPGESRPIARAPKRVECLEANTVEAIERLQKNIPAGNLHDMVRYLMMRGLQTVQAEVARRGNEKRDLS